MRKISVALCTYNGERYLAEQLNSLLAQTTLPSEVVACDDASNDGTLEILTDFQRSAPFEIRIYTNEKNVGYVKNFEQTLLRCRGDIIFPSDQDDIWHADKIATIISVFEKDQSIQMVATDAALVDSGGSPLNTSLWRTFGFSRQEIDCFSENALETLLFSRNFISGNTVAVRSNLSELLTMYPVPTGSAHDHWLGVIAALTSRLSILDFQSIDYRQHDNQIFGAGNGEQLSRRSLGLANERFRRIVESAIIQANSYKGLIEMLDLTARGRESGFSLPPCVVERNKEQLERKISALTRQAEHYSARSTLGKNRIGRLPQIFRQLRKGRYGEHSSGFHSAFLDLIRK